MRHGDKPRSPEPCRASGETDLPGIFEEVVEVRRKLLAVVAASFLVVTIAGPAVAVTHGTADGNNHPYVGLLVFDTDVEGVPTPSWRCSGALITPTVVLTAAHCTNDAVAARIWLQEDVTYDVVPYPKYPFGGPGSGAIEGTPYVFPGYLTNFGNGNGLPTFSFGDVGIVVLDEPASVTSFAELPTAGLVDTLKNMTALDYVGFGVQAQAQVKGVELPQPPPYYRWSGPRVRNYATGQLISGKFQGSDDLIKVSMNPGGDRGGTCFGDSGGPDLLGGTDTVLAVNSFVTNVNCGGVGYDTRVDVPDVLDWIDGFIP